MNIPFLLSMHFSQYLKEKTNKSLVERWRKKKRRMYDFSHSHRRISFVCVLFFIVIVRRWTKNKFQYFYYDYAMFFFWLLFFCFLLIKCVFTQWSGLGWRKCTRTAWVFYISKGRWRELCFSLDIFGMACGGGNSVRPPSIKKKSVHFQLYLFPRFVKKSTQVMN